LEYLKEREKSPWGSLSVGKRSVMLWTIQMVRWSVVRWI